MPEDPTSFVLGCWVGAATVWIAILLVYGKDLWPED